MKYKNILILVFYLSISSINAHENIALLDEYKLLHTDLMNINTYGYKSYFNWQLSKANPIINISQGTILTTENSFHCAIAGEGFFKIRLENNLIGYTRAGEFVINSEGELVTSNGYSFFEPIFLGNNFLSDSLRITLDHNIYIKTIDNNEIKEIFIGTMNTYNIPNVLLEYYKDGIYIINDNTNSDDGLITYENKIFQGALEDCNYDLLPVVLRMYYILSVLDNTIINNIEFKKELLKIQIENMAKNNETNRAILQNLKGEKYDIMVYYIESKTYYIESIIPFIAYDY